MAVQNISTVKSTQQIKNSKEIQLKKLEKAHVLFEKFNTDHNEYIDRYDSSNRGALEQIWKLCNSDRVNFSTFFDNIDKILNINVSYKAPFLEDSAPDSIYNYDIFGRMKSISSKQVQDVNDLKKLETNGLIKKYGKDKNGQTVYGINIKFHSLEYQLIRFTWDQNKKMMNIINMYREDEFGKFEHPRY